MFFYPINECFGASIREKVNFVLQYCSSIFSFYIDVYNSKHIML